MLDYEEQTNTKITVSKIQLGKFYGMGKPTFIEGLDAETVRGFLGLEKNEYKNLDDFKKTLDRAACIIRYLDTFLPVIAEACSDINIIHEDNLHRENITVNRGNTKKVIA